MPPVSGSVRLDGEALSGVIPAEAGIQVFSPTWIPAFAGMTGRS